MAKLIGFSGYARSGKDEAAAALIRELGFVRVAFADPLKEMALRVDPRILHNGEFVPLSVVVNVHGWEKAKANPEVRRILQNLGVAARDILSENAWLDLADKAVFENLAQGRNVVITDVRFPNEVNFIRGAGTLIRIERPGIGAVNNHVSESAISDMDPDYTLVNAGSLDEWHVAVQEFVGGLLCEETEEEKTQKRIKTFESICTEPLS